MSDAPILVCACGKRLRAPGAVPGRVGRCPACGGELRVPAAREGPTAPGVDPSERPAPTRRTAARTGNPPRAAPRTREVEIWDGLIAAPSSPETSIRESLLYPLWGATGVSLLVVMPPLLWITSLPFVTAYQTYQGGQTTFELGLMFLLLPAGLGLAAVVAYTLMFLGRVLASSAEGDRHHPRWPDWELSGLAFGLGRWAWAGVVGMAVGGIPAVAYWVYCGDVDLFDGLILAELTAVGAVYALMGLLASILHEDVLAANPFTVVGAIRRVGWGYVRPCLLAGFAVVLAATLLAATFKVTSPALSAFLFWAFWVAGLYEAMVVLRVLGLCYHQNARALGWFRGRSRWGG